MAPVQVAYVEHVGNVEGDEEIFDVILERLLAWAAPQRLWDFPENTRLYLIYPDNPEETPPERRRLWLGINVPEETETAGGIGTVTLPEGRYAVGAFKVTAREFGQAWSYMTEEWLPQSGFLSAGGYSFEIQKNDSSLDPQKKHVVDICIPVRRNRQIPPASFFR